MQNVLITSSSSTFCETSRALPVPFSRATGWTRYSHTISNRLLRTMGGEAREQRGRGKRIGRILLDWKMRKSGRRLRPSDASRHLKSALPSSYPLPLWKMLFAPSPLYTSLCRSTIRRARVCHARARAHTRTCREMRMVALQNGTINNGVEQKDTMLSGWDTRDRGPNVLSMGEKGWATGEVAGRVGKTREIYISDIITPCNINACYFAYAGISVCVFR